MQTKISKEKARAKTRWYKFKTIEETIIYTDGKEDIEKTLAWRKKEKSKMYKKGKVPAERKTTTEKIIANKYGKIKKQKRKKSMTDKEMKNKASELAKLFSKGKVQSKLEIKNRKGKLGLKSGSEE